MYILKATLAIRFFNIYFMSSSIIIAFVLYTSLIFLEKLFTFNTNY